MGTTMTPRDGFNLTRHAQAQMRARGIRYETLEAMLAAGPTGTTHKGILYSLGKVYAVVCGRDIVTVAHAMPHKRLGQLKRKHTLEHWK